MPKTIPDPKRPPSRKELQAAYSSLQEKPTRQAEVEGEEFTSPTMYPAFRKRLEEDDPTARRILLAGDQSAEVVATFLEKKEDLEEDGRWSEDGIRRKLQEEAEERFLSDRGDPKLPGKGLPRLRQQLRAARQEIQERKNEVRQALVPERDPSDAASAVTEMEIRSRLSDAESVSDRMDLARELVSSGDPVALRAIFGAPSSAFHGIDEGGLDRLKRDAVRTLFEDRDPLEEIESLENAYRKAAHNLQNAEKVIRKTAGIR